MEKKKKKGNGEKEGRTDEGVGGMDIQWLYRCVHNAR